MSRISAFWALAVVLTLTGCTWESTPVVPVAATPAFTPGAGSYSAAQSVTISDGTAGASIYYTTNGTIPTTGSTPYTGPVTVASNETIEAIAVAAGYSDSAVAIAAYTIAAPVTATPVFAPTPGSYSTPISVTISDATPGASIYYTTDGTTPTVSSMPYARAIPVSATTTFEAIAIAPGYQDSAVAKATYTISLTGNQWTWMSGSQNLDVSPVYGTQGVAAAGNTPGGRSAAVSMTDASGNFWLFGGFTNGGVANDLWEYSTATNEWTWVSGSNQPNSPGSYGGLGGGTPTPSARTAAGGWVDKSGNIWIFGGQIANSNSGSPNYASDLWEYDITRQLWEFVAGPQAPNQTPTYGTKGVPSATTNPGSLDQSSSCTDSSGNLWIFGGQSAGTQQEIANSLWEFNPTIGEWTWVSGNTVLNSVGTYGTKGVPSTANVPGSRVFASCWGDLQGNIWIFGGIGLDNSGTATGFMELNDLWEFTPSAKTWTWVSGSNVRNSTGSYGTQGVEASSNVPPARDGAASWVDANDNLWLFGGVTMYAVGSTQQGVINDLWRFNPFNGNWTWMTGSDAQDAPSVYGVLDVSSAGSTPGARSGQVMWTSSDGKLWLYGENGQNGSLSDMWRYQP